MKLSDLILAGANTEGSGALTGWSGAGQLCRRDILEALSDAMLSAGLAPAPKSDVGHAGAALSALRSLGYVVRRARAAAWRSETTGQRRRSYRARWTVAIADAAAAALGAPLGEVVVIAELRDGDSELRLEHHQAYGDIADRVESEYNAALAMETYSSGDVTSWLRRVLVDHFGAARFGVGYYVPAASRTDVAALVAAMASRWGCSWISPPLPVATSDELAMGLARGFGDDIDAVARELATERRAAARRHRDGKVDSAQITPACAARLLSQLADIDERADGYRSICGPEAVAGAAAKLRELVAELEPIADDASRRFALLELDGPIAEPVTDTRSGAERVADALAERRAELAERQAVETVDSADIGDDIDAREREAAALLADHDLGELADDLGDDLADATIAPVEPDEPTDEPAPPAPDVDSQAYTRFGLLELD